MSVGSSAASCSCAFRYRVRWIARTVAPGTNARRAAATGGSGKPGMSIAG